MTSGDSGATIPATTPIEESAVLKPRRRWTPGLLQQVILALGLVGLGPLLLASIRLSTVNRDALTEQVLRTHAVYATTAADRVGTMVTARRSLVRVAAANYEGLASLSGSESRQILTDLLDETSELGTAAVAILGPDGRNILRAQRQGAAAAAESLLIGTARSPISIVDFEGSPWLKIAVPLAEETVLGTLFDAAPLQDAIQPDELGNEAALALAHRDGRVLLGSVRSLTSFPAELVEAAKSQHLSGSGRYPGVDDEVLGAYSPVQGTDWFVVSRQPARIAEAVATRMRRQSIYATAAAVALTALISFVAYRTLVRPIRELIGAQNTLAGTDTGGGGEIAQLRAAFEAMERHIEKQEKLDKVFLGRYQVMEVIGEGAMGSVFLGWDPRLRRPVALKTIKLSKATKEQVSVEVGADLLNEAITAARFNHPNIISIYDFEDTPDFSFIAMEFVEGTSLNGYLQKEGHLPIDEVILTGAGVAKALAEAHARGVLHNDIKPGNVLMGQGGEVKVTDFGISQAMSSVAEKAGCLFGTPGYVPPETIAGRGRDESADLFALGVLLYECLAGSNPFFDRTVTQSLVKTLQEKPPPPVNLRPDMPLELNKLIQELMEKDPARRPESAAAVFERLEKIAASRDASWSLEIPETGDLDKGTEILLSQIMPSLELDGLTTEEPTQKMAQGTSDQIDPESET